MILKIYNFCNNGWNYIDNVSSIFVDNSYYLQYLNKKDSKDIDKRCIIPVSMNIDCLVFDKRGNFPIIDNIDGKGPTIFLFDPVILSSRFAENDTLVCDLNIVSLQKIILKKGNNEEEKFFILPEEERNCSLKQFTEHSFEPIGWLLNDNGKTIEKI